MTKEEIIKIIQEEEARLYEQQKQSAKYYDRGGFFKEHKWELYKCASSEWNAICVLMEKLDIKKLNN